MKTKILQLEEFIVAIPKKIRNFIFDSIDQFYVSLNKMRNLSQTNYNLGIFHIDKGNMNDAKMRFLFTVKLKPDFALAHYHLARCYLFTLAFDKAKHEFETAISLDENLAEAKYRLDILNKNIKLKEVPIQVIQEDYNNLAHAYENYVENQQKYNAPEILSRKIAEYFKESEVDTKNMNALDLGCGTGLVGIFLSQLVSIKSLTGIDVSRNMLVLAKELEINNNPIYNYTEECDFKERKVTKDKYDIITACMSLNYNSDLSNVCAKIDSLTTEDAVIGVVFLKSDTGDTTFNYDNACFAFSEKYLLKIFKTFNWNVICHEELKLFSSGDKGLMFILSK